MSKLYSVATPIGNLGDITYRAVEVLQSVDLITCEDTRVSKTLLNAYDITTPVKTYHQHSSEKTEQEVIEYVQAGHDVAIITDAGTPGISDPGSRLIQRAVQAGIEVVPIPGATAFVTALQVAGVDTSSFVYLGFLPHKKGRQTLFAQIELEQRTVVCYESPHRLMKTLEALRNFEKHIIVGRELTKKFEEFVRGTPEEVYQNFTARDAIKGEIVLIISSS